MEKQIKLPEKRVKYQVINGCHFPADAKRDDVLSALNYQAKESDIFITTFPKCGTTWTQQIVALLLNNGVLDETRDLYEYVPFIDYYGTKSLSDGYCAIKTHLPFHLQPYNVNAKYIYVARNPKDACVSFYYHTKSFKEYDFKGDFHDYLKCWLLGEIDWCKYSEHLLSWWPHRNEANVLFLLFEEMKTNFDEIILKIAKFIDEKLFEKLKSNQEFFDNVKKFSSFNYMKEKINTNFETKWKDECTGESFEFVRKGVIGDWRNHFTEEENEFMNKWFLETFNGTGIEHLWDKYHVFQ